eukprot:TRINITY_DN53006_c0_g1_i2.p4 TRINITY_DN53006_c0_g1~~TRINITY_DN53006_c0_g1_i2.p4  ORF type:complete len:133 (-),score=29.47 TRINITY_DN53006_c0_g1_i2:108-506(-)
MECIFVVDWNLIGILSAFVIYFGVMIYIGFFFMKKNKTAGDYILGGRKLPPLVSAMSAEASDMSGWLLLGLPGMAYAFDLSSAGSTAIGLAIGTYLNLSLIHISEPTRPLYISYAVFCLKKKKKNQNKKNPI